MGDYAQAKEVKAMTNRVIDWTAKRIRQERGPRTSQKQFAAKIGVHPQTIWNWENGTRKPDLRGLRLLDRAAAS